MLAENLYGMASLPYNAARAAAELGPNIYNRLPGATARNAAELMAMALPIPGMKRAPLGGDKIKAWHGSPKDFTEFVTPAFFSSREGIAQLYRRDAGGQDNMNGLGGYEAPEGWYWAHGAMDRAGQDRARAIALLAQDTETLSKPTQQWHYQPRGFLDKLLGRQPEVTQDFRDFVQRHSALNQSGIDFLKSGAPLGKIYEVELPRPTANYNGDQQAAIADAMAKGHKVITFYNRGPDSGEIAALDKNVINILRKYGIATPVAGASLADMLSQPSTTER